MVLLVFLLTRKLTKSNPLAFLSATVVAISPASIFISREQSDPLLAVFLILMGFYVFLFWSGSKKTILLIFCYGIWILSLFSYAVPRVFLVGFIPLLLIFYWKNLCQKQRLLFMLGFVILMTINASLLLGNSAQRFSQLNVFNTPIVQLRLDEQIREDREKSYYYSILS